VLEYPHRNRYLSIKVPNKTIPIRQLPTGCSAVIHRIKGHPDNIHRLEEFGLRGGSRIEMFRPGNPCIIRLGGSKICLRAGELVDVLVEPITTA
jgi:ferrous iron transport protein A